MHTPAMRLQLAIPLLIHAANSHRNQFQITLIYHKTTYEHFHISSDLLSPFCKTVYPSPKQIKYAYFVLPWTGSHVPLHQWSASLIRSATTQNMNTNKETSWTPQIRRKDVGCTRLLGLHVEAAAELWK